MSSTNDLYIPHGSDESSEACCAFSSKYSLYIPHGSDESFTSMRYANEVPSFISHMVQMKDRLAELLENSLISLYPTWFRWKYKNAFRNRTLAITLYPTWFRWKIIIMRYFLIKFNFISHMVQMKAETVQRCVSGKSSFISHMVQMKVTRILLPKSGIILYIPHGSDERYLWLLSSDFSFSLYIPHGSDERREGNNE